MARAGFNTSMYLYFGKMRGRTLCNTKPHVKAAWQSFVGAFVGMLILAALERFYSGPTPNMLLIGSFGASICMIFGMQANPFAQPRNVVGGHMISALCGVSANMLAGDILWLGCALAVSSALALMHLTRTFHPPGGATALIALIGGPFIISLGYSYVFIPVGVGSCVLVVLGMLFHNFFRHRRYPLYWF